MICKLKLSGYRWKQIARSTSEPALHLHFLKIYIKVKSSYVAVERKVIRDQKVIYIKLYVYPRITIYSPYNLHSKLLHRNRRFTREIFYRDEH